MSENESHGAGDFMTHDEFVHLVNSMCRPGCMQISSISDEDFSVIETVYRYHPAIDGMFGREKIADLYANFGFIVIMDMLPRAEKMKRMEEQLADIQSSLTALYEEMDAVRKDSRLPLC